MTRSFCDDQIINQAIGCFNVTSNYLTIFIAFCVFCNFCASERATFWKKSRKVGLNTVCPLAMSSFCCSVCFQNRVWDGKLDAISCGWMLGKNVKSEILFIEDVACRSFSESFFFGGACGFQNAHAWQCFGCREILVYRPSTWEFITNLEVISR